MNRSTSKRLGVIGTVIAAALALPLLLSLASAGTDGGMFKVRSVNSDDSTITATVGMEGKVDEPDPTYPTITCGDQVIVLTDEFLAHSQSNLEGFELAMTTNYENLMPDAEGWALIVEFGPEETDYEFRGLAGPHSTGQLLAFQKDPVHGFNQFECGPYPQD